jgi:hypothetical protein
MNKNFEQTKGVGIASPFLHVQKLPNLGKVEA